jgi:hypothetical protein
VLFCQWPCSGALCSLLALASHWFQDAAGSHITLIPFVSIFLIYWMRERIFAHSPSFWRWWHRRNGYCGEPPVGPSEAVGKPFALFGYMFSLLDRVFATMAIQRRPS